jgi:hypothetical protein
MNLGDGSKLSRILITIESGEIDRWFAPYMNIKAMAHVINKMIRSAYAFMKASEISTFCYLICGSNIR